MADASQPGDAEKKPEPTDEAPEDLLSLAKRAFEAGKLGDCMVALEAGKAGGSLPEAQIDRQKLIVRMHILAERKEWWKVVRAGPDSSDMRFKPMPAKQL